MKQKWIFAIRFGDLGFGWRLAMMRRSEAPILQCSLQPPGGGIGIEGEDKGTFSLYFCIAGSDGRLMVLVGNLVFCLWVKSETKSVTPDTGFRFNSKD
jgi:hypothetical protein